MNKPFLIIIRSSSVPIGPWPLFIDPPDILSLDENFIKNLNSMNCLQVMDKSEFEYCGGYRELHDF
jgi:hypothetical protein